MEAGTKAFEVQPAEDPKELFKEFLRTYRDRKGSLKYRERISTMVNLNQTSLMIDWNDLYLFEPKLALMVINEPEKAIAAAKDAIRELVQQENPSYAAQVEVFMPRFRNLPEVTPIRKLRSSLVGKMVMVEGILVKATPIKEKIVKAHFIHAHPECNQEFEWPLEGELGEYIETPPICPLCGKMGGHFKLLAEKSRMIDWQKVVLQERPEEVPSGQLPRGVEVHLTRDLVDTARPGDRVTVVGVLKVKQDRMARRGSRAVFDMYIEANHVEVSQKVLEELIITREDEERILELSRDPWVRQKIIASIAPAIYGHWDVKEAIALLLFGGVPKVLKDGTRIRGDIHVLLIGDPGTAKSQLLQYAARISPRGIYTSGKGSTAAGLTAAVVRDKTTGDYYLEAGALVLADGGVACIDEIDKMRDEDRVAIHEAMEQQTVSIAKAGIVARLNARASVLAAGNPKFGRYLSNRTLAENINLPVTILSRFDLIFVLKDVPEESKDLGLASHVLRVHKEAEKVEPEIPPDLLRKYIGYARRYVKPRLTEGAIKLLEEFFVSMRKISTESPESPVAVTARQLEALIRLAEAHARMALKTEVTEEDAEEAIRLMKVFLEGVGIDVESGAIDIDVIMTGKPRSQQEKMAKLLELIEELESDSEEGCVRIKELVRRAEEEGLDSRFVERAIRVLKREGTIFEKRLGCISIVK